VSFSDQLDSDMEDTFLNTSDFAETVTYRVSDGTTVSISAVIIADEGTVGDFELARILISNDSTLGVASPAPGEQLTPSGEKRWTILKVRTTPSAHNLDCARPVERT
jgi:hypothetical protein